MDSGDWANGAFGLLGALIGAGTSAWIFIRTLREKKREFYETRLHEVTDSMMTQAIGLLRQITEHEPGTIVSKSEYRMYQSTWIQACAYARRSGATDYLSALVRVAVDSKKWNAFAKSPQDESLRREAVIDVWGPFKAASYWLNNLAGLGGGEVTREAIAKDAEEFGRSNAQG